MPLSASSEYQRVLREYYEFHDMLWRVLGQPGADQVRDRMAWLMNRLDIMKPDWWRDSIPS